MRPDMKALLSIFGWSVVFTAILFAIGLIAILAEQPPKTAATLMAGWCVIGFFVGIPLLNRRYLAALISREPSPSAANAPGAHTGTDKMGLKGPDEKGR